MGNPQIHNSTTRRMSVNVALCGSIPRSSFINQPGAPCGLQELSSRLHGFESKSHCIEDYTSQSQCENEVGFGKCLNVGPLLSERRPLGRVCEAPAWAVPAKGDSRLEVSHFFSISLLFLVAVILTFLFLL